MKDDDLDLRIYSRRGGRPRLLVRPARTAPAASGPAPRRLPLLVLAQTLPAAPVRMAPMSPMRAGSAERLDEAGTAEPPQPWRKDE